MNVRDLYQFLLRLYPPAYRQLFEDEMLRVFDEMYRDLRDEGGIARAVFIAGEIGGACNGVVREWARIAGRRRPSSSMLSPELSWPQELREAKAEVDRLVGQIVFAIANHQFENARVFARQETIARERFTTLRLKFDIPD